MDAGIDHSRGAVLVVDDEFLLREYAAEVLEAEGFEVVQAANAEEALEVLEERPDVAVLFTDVNMPGPIDGLELARIVREERPHAHVVVTSGRGHPHPDELPKDSRFLPKPYYPEAISRTFFALFG